MSGGTASGKTTVCDMIIQQLHDHRVVLVNQVCRFYPLLLVVSMSFYWKLVVFQQCRTRFTVAWLLKNQNECMSITLIILVMLNKQLKYSCCSISAQLYFSRKAENFILMILVVWISPLHRFLKCFNWYSRCLWHGTTSRLHSEAQSWETVPSPHIWFQNSSSPLR